jgi:PadR family transcriptional regulator, regulatory protein AphA
MRPALEYRAPVAGRRKEELSQTEAVILGFLAGGERSGYDLSLMFEGLKLMWAPAKGHMYAVLPRLVEMGWATSREVTEGRRPPKQIYRITPRGRTALKRWLEEPIEPDPERNMLLVKLFFGDRVGREAVLRHVADRREAAETLLSELRALQRQADESGRPQGVYPWLTRRYGILWAQMMIRWASEAEAAIADAEPGQRPLRRPSSAVRGR